MKETEVCRAIGASPGNRSSVGGVKKSLSERISSHQVSDIGARPHKEKINKILKIYKLTDWPADDLSPIE